MCDLLYSKKTVKFTFFLICKTILIFNFISISLESSVNELGETNLHLAVRNKNQDDVIKLLESGYDVNAKNNFGLTPLHYASRIDNIDILNLILNKKPNVSLFFIICHIILTNF